MEIINDQSFNKLQYNAFLNIVGEQEGLKKALDQLVEEGYLLKKKNFYCNPSLYNVFRGQIQVKDKGYGFVTIEGHDDVFIPKNNVNGAFSGDIVLVQVCYEYDDDFKSEGDVIRIIERGAHTIVGTFKRGQGFNLIISDNPNDKFNILVKDEDSLGAMNDHKVKACISEYGPNYVYATVTKILGSINDPGIDILSVCYKYDLETKFSDEVYQEAASISDTIDESEIEGRIDRRDYTVVTIDGEDAKDLDDAVSVKRLDNGNFFLGVYIADVSHYVKRDSKIDQEAYLRGTSVYLVDRVIPMLPERLCNGICSLNPHVDRLVIACEMEIDQNGHVVNSHIFPSVINSNERMTYTAVNAILDNDEIMVARYQYLKSFFDDMADLASILSDARYLRGAIDFETKEPKFKVDEKGYPLEIYIKPRGIAEGIIEEFMLMANETVARTINQMNLPFIYRVHEAPDKKKINAVLNVIKNMGYKAGFLSDEITPRDCQSLLLSLEGKPGAEGINILMLRSMMKARYSEECLGHYGLALKYYTHFTSPIRRYPDTLVHRMLHEFLFEKKTNQENINYWINHLPEFALYTSQCEKTAVDCERDVISMKAAEYMEGHIGEVFDGIISSLTNFGMFVELPNGVEGLIHISKIDFDYYSFDEQRMIIIGEMSRRYFQLGDRVRVKVTNASKAAKTIDFGLVKSIDNHVKGKKKKGGKHENHRSKQKGRV